MSKQENMAGYKDLLKHRNYVFVLVSNTLTGFGFTIFQVVLFWLAYRMSANSFEAAVVVQSSAIPYLFFGLVGGVYADHGDKKQLILRNQLGTGLMMAAIVAMFAFHLESIWYVALASFFIVTFRCFYSPAIRSLVSATLPESLWQQGNALFQLSGQLSRTMAPICGGVLLTHLSESWIFLILLLLMLVPLAFVMPLHLEQKKGSEGVHLLKELKSTFTFLQTRPNLLLSIIIFGIVLLFFTGMERIGLPVVSDQHWHTGAEGFSILLTLFGIGSAVGAFILGKITMPSSYARLIMAACMLWGLGLMGIGLSPNLYLAGVFALLTGVMEAFIDLPMVLMIQKYTPEQKLGQVFSFFSTVAFIGEAGAGLLAAFMMEWAGMVNSFMMVAGCIILVCGAALLWMRKSSRMEPTAVQEYR
ncbi:MFS transporter [Paenibacillus puldeungensis]|uniref:MFS transporter n=1 Tax=Paenibacillus puldeungensis TaxID=696536 RepID=A0ABW3RWB8_9BACL